MMMLQTKQLLKRFGGVAAADHVGLEVRVGETHALIGPNGAGKTTLVALISGELVQDSGTIEFEGRDISCLSVHARSRIGLARSFQVTSIFPDMSTLANVVLAVQAHAGHSYRCIRPALADEDLTGPAKHYLARVGILDRASVRASYLSHGEKRALEIAMALATGPKMLLLDEPLAGMGSEEATQMIALLRELKSTLTILLVEHDMEAVYALADRITVLVDGRVVATGSVEDIQRNENVRSAYLGEGE